MSRAKKSEADDKLSGKKKTRTGGNLPNRKKHASQKGGGD